jgi:hypothetical protein
VLKERHTLTEYRRHADLFGSDCVLETAMADLTPLELIDLENHLVRVDREWKKRHGFKNPPKRQKLPRRVYQAAVRQYLADGVPPKRIAFHLSRSVDWVYDVARELQGVSADPRAA